MGAPARGRGGYYAVVILLAISLVNAFDRNVASVVNELIRAEWSLTDAQLGILFAAFLVTYALAGIPLARISDRSSRTRVIVVATVVWSLLTGLGGLARSYTQLVAVRAAVGFGEAAFYPAAMSLLADEFVTTRRSKAVSVVMIGAPLGAALSFGIGGAIARKLGWRAPFFVAVVPGLIFALAALLIREAKRGAAEAHSVGSRVREGSAASVLLRVPTLWIVTLASSLFFFCISTFATFLLPLLMRYHGLPVDKGGAAVGLMVGIAPVIGLMTGGIMADRIRRRRTDAALLVSGITATVAVPLFLLALGRPPHATVSFIVCMSLGVAGMAPLISLSQTAIQDVVEPSLRASAIAVHGLVSSVLGALGPVVVGYVSDRLTAGAAQSAGVTGSAAPLLEPFRPVALHQALYIAPCVVAFMALLLLGARAVMRGDVARLEAWSAGTSGTSGTSKEVAPGAA